MEFAFPWTTDNVEHLFTCSVTICLIFGEMSLEILCLFFSGVFLLLLLSYNESLIFGMLKIENAERCVSFQDKVLHNIMSIFTFMGASVMRLDDTYSFQVINKTVKMVIPALIQVSCFNTIVGISFNFIIVYSMKPKWHYKPFWNAQVFVLLKF